MDLELKDRVVLVAGGSGLIGRAVVERLRLEGATALVASRSTADGEHGLTLDARDQESVDAAFRTALERHGRLDGLVVTAAPSARTLDPARNSDPAQVLEAVDAKALSFLRLANAALPVMTEAGFGRIVGVSGQNAFLTGNVTGSVRNAALVIAAKNLADAVAGSGVTVNTVSPGLVTQTPAAEVKPGTPGESSPAQIADLIAFLVSPLAGAISGGSIAIGHRTPGAVSL
ncbi:SDR family oxidoreductase [Kineosporia sp. J2-2]|uniref:SDR family oxidoreductase n=1 Tax=Kineosporia corallincola TaxID=2835133 RepID=A0ABS5TE87_9ACTN|nr:SDR family oxidoreductase [Kineosporia corallincola]MBT0768536.1 SDR family oxidoreductase [Kineosporia corallincola]